MKGTAMAQKKHGKKHRIPLIIRCSDGRLTFKNAMRKHKHELFGDLEPDVIAVPGPVKKLADRKFYKSILRDIAALKRLHYTPTACLYHHVDCGYCGGSKAYITRKVNEIEVVTKELKKARRTVLEQFPKLKVRLFLQLNVGGTIEIVEVQP